MDAFASELNTILVDTFRTIMKIEENTVRKMKNSDLTISEVHVLEAVGKTGGPRTVSDIAQELGISLPSVTVAINKLAKKGYVSKSRCAKDGRQVLLSLTKAGVTIYQVHRYFHEQLVRNVSKGFDESEKALLLRAMRNLNDFFAKQG